MPWNEPGSGDKDPWGKPNRGNSQNPDLEQVINNVRKKFGGNSSGNGDMFNGLPLWGLVAVGLLILWAIQSVYTVQAGYQSVELRLGKYTSTQEAGLNFIFWPFEKKYILDTQKLRTVEVGYRGSQTELREALMLTNDENIVDVTMAVQYTIKSMEDLLFNVGDIGRADGMGLDMVVRGATESALREVVGRTEMNELLTSGRAVIDTETKSLLQAILDRYQTGVQISSIEIQDAKPPVQVREAFDDVVKADQDKETFINRAEAYSKKLVPNARGAAARMLQEAEAYKSRVVAEATGEAERFNQILVEYRKAPEVTKKRLYIETMEQVLGNTSKVMVDSSSGGNSLMYLPIDKILENKRDNINTGSSVRTSPSQAINTRSSTPSVGSTRTNVRSPR